MQNKTIAVCMVFVRKQYMVMISNVSVIKDLQVNIKKYTFIKFKLSLYFYTVIQVNFAKLSYPLMFVIIILAEIAVHVN